MASAAFAAITAAGTGLTGCGSSSSTAASSSTVRIGTLPTEDILPMWIAEQKDLFKECGVTAEVTVFDSAPNLSAAITAGEVDLAMTDTMRAVKLCEAGTQVDMEWITLGGDASQGRFGVMTSAQSGIKSLADLVGCTKGVGLAANTVPEYVFECLCKQAGIDPGTIMTSEVPSLADRYSLMASNQLDAAALPGSLLAMGEANGMVLLADDTKGDNVSQSVMVARAAYAKDNAEAITNVAKAWDEAAELVNANPEEYRSLLVEKANLNSQIADTYPISTYPKALDSAGALAYPAAKYVTPIVEWMTSKGYCQKQVTYDASTGVFEVK